MLLLPRCTPYTCHGVLTVSMVSWHGKHRTCDDVSTTFHFRAANTVQSRNALPHAFPLRLFFTRHIARSILFAARPSPRHPYHRRCPTEVLNVFSGSTGSEVETMLCWPKYCCVRLSRLVYRDCRQIVCNCAPGWRGWWADRWVACVFGW